MRVRERVSFITNSCDMWPSFVERRSGKPSCWQTQGFEGTHCCRFGEGTRILGCKECQVAVRSANMAKVCEALNICWSFSHRVALQHNSTLSLHLVRWVFRTGWSTAVGSAPKSHWHAFPLIDHRTRSCQFLTDHNQPLSR